MEKLSDVHTFRQTLYRVLLIQLVALGALAVLQLVYH